jgi:hypothetical protein
MGKRLDDGEETATLHARGAKMKKWLVLVLKLLTTGTMTLFLAACYGVMTVLDYSKDAASSTTANADGAAPLTLEESARHTVELAGK